MTLHFSQLLTRYFLIVSLTLLPNLSHSAPPTPLSADELTERENILNETGSEKILTPPTKEETKLRQDALKEWTGAEAQQADAEKLLSLSHKENAKVNAYAKAFLVNINAKSDALDAEANPPKEEPAKSKSDGKDAMTITCEDGLYFDAEKGLLVYLKDVRLTDPRFSLQCDNNLKVFLEKGQKKAKDKKTTKANESKTTSKPEANSEAPKTETAKPAPGEPGSEGDPLNPVPGKLNFNFSGIKMITASGNVIVTSKDDKGNPIIAKAAEASYNGKSGEIVLSGGGTQSVQNGTNRITVTGKGSYIRIYGNGSVFIKGKQVVTSLDDLKEKNNPFKSRPKS